MKIAIPVSSKEQDGAVAASFGRAAYFLVHDETTGLQTILENPAAQNTGGAGIQAAQVLVDSGVGTLLTPQCGNNAAKVLHTAGLKLYKTDSNLSARDNLKAFQQNTLEELVEIHAGYHYGH
ncbi:MAG: dinitrogenase iron-molybdenum cofactor biosynthesis protein [Desulfobulbus sp.]|nr:dinitrogenase iron-molybdenum cofactor biosynthesis protein [Desulfobulbus sp.]